MSQDQCDFCGLPVSASRGTVAERNPQPVYCCFGCEFAAEVTRSSGSEGLNRALLIRVGLAAFCTMNVLAFTMVLWSHDVYHVADEPRVRVLDDVLRYLGLLFTLPVWFVLGQPLLSSAIGGMRRGRVSTDFLICIGVLASLAFSISSTIRGTGAVYYEVGCIILVLITLGRWLESQGKLQASSALNQLEQLLPSQMRVCIEGQPRMIPAADVRVGDELHVHAGECVGVDGLIISGQAAIDEHLLTGESWPVEKTAGDVVRAGSFNLDGLLKITATSTAAGGSLGQLVEAIRRARQERGHYERIAEHAIRWFLPAVILTTIAATTWHAWYYGIEQGILTGLSVLLIACPCALGLATPLATWTAFGYAARRLVLFRNAETLERLATIKLVAWDKTGTLTTAEPTVKSTIWRADLDPALLHREIMALAAQSNHPYSRAVASCGEQAASPSLLVSDVCELPGRGIVGQSATGHALCLGNIRLAQELALNWSLGLKKKWQLLSAEGHPLLVCGRDGQVIGIMVIAETLRAGVADAVYQLQMTGTHQLVLTGDQSERAGRLLASLFETRRSVDKSGPDVANHALLTARFDVAAGLTPEEKVAAIKAARQTYGSVAMVGDGINDVAALDAADVGISLRSAADISRDSAGVCLLHEDLRLVPWSISYAQFVVRIIRENLFWSFGYNIVGITLAATGNLSPTIAAILMAGSSVMVIANSCRLNRPPCPPPEFSPVPASESSSNLDQSSTQPDGHSEVIRETHAGSVLDETCHPPFVSRKHPV